MDIDYIISLANDFELKFNRVPINEYLSRIKNNTDWYNIRKDIEKFWNCTELNNDMIALYVAKSAMDLAIKMEKNYDISNRR